MAFGQDFLNSLPSLSSVGKGATAAFFGNDYVKDYTHASKTFRSNGYENSPRLKFLFHVYFNLNTDPVNGIPQLANIFQAGSQSTLGLLVKNIELPKFEIDVDVLNQYNRKRIVQKRIQYNPINVTFHDDGGDLIRTMWYNYFAYYYKDPTQGYRGQANSNGNSGPSTVSPAGFDYNSRDIYSNSRAVNDWGYIGESYSDATNTPGGKPAFFRDISIYGFNQHKFVEYVLINPMITKWSHDNYDYSIGDGVMENTMTISFETVKYYTGAIGTSRPDTNVQGFADPNVYDTVPGPLGRPGGTASILGQGGLLDAGIGIYEDLQSGSVMGLLGAVQKAGRTYNTFKKQNLGQIAGAELQQGLLSATRQQAQMAITSKQSNGPTGYYPR